MFGNIKKMDYEEAEQMIKILNEACKQLNDTIGEVESIAGVLEEGALLGEAGDAFANGIRKQLVGAINRLINGFEDGAKYVALEKADMMAAEQKSAKLF
jgi:uncharacterized protein YukE